jgi:hypothetical protein
VIDEVDAVFLVEMQYDLGVGPGLEAVSPLLEVLSELDEVVDLAVDDHRDGVVFVGHWLGALGPQVDDRQAAVAEHAGAVGSQTVVIWTAMDHRVAHASDRFGLRHRLLIDR